MVRLESVLHHQSVLVCAPGGTWAVGVAVTAWAIGPVPKLEVGRCRRTECSQVDSVMDEYRCSRVFYSHLRSLRQCVGCAPSWTLNTAFSHPTTPRPAKGRNGARGRARTQEISAFRPGRVKRGPWTDPRGFMIESQGKQHGNRRPGTNKHECFITFHPFPSQLFITVTQSCSPFIAWVRIGQHTHQCQSILNSMRGQTPGYSFISQYIHILYTHVESLVSIGSHVSSDGGQGGHSHPPPSLLRRRFSEVRAAIARGWSEKEGVSRGLERCDPGVSCHQHETPDTGCWSVGIVGSQPRSTL